MEAEIFEIAIFHICRPKIVTFLASIEVTEIRGQKLGKGP